MIKLEWLNMQSLREMRKISQETDDPMKVGALKAILEHCKSLNSKWILSESDLSILENTYFLVEQIARSYHPESSHPVEEARIRWVLKAFMDLKNRLLALTTWRGVHTVTQFRVHHVLLLSRAWKLKEEWKDWRVVKFLTRHGLYPLFQWLFYLIRWLDLTFWAIRMMAFILQDIIFKVFLVRWYLIVGELAIQVYRDREKEPDIQPEDLLEDFNSIPEMKHPKMADLSEEILIISDSSRDDILFHSWSVEWEKAKGIYIKLLENIAQHHHPESKQPIYEAKLFDLMMGGVRFSEKIAAIQNFPVFNKLLDFRIAHVLMVKDTADYFINSKALSWIREYKLTYIVKYALLIFKVVRKGNPALLFQDFVLTLAGEGFKRWLYLYLHDRITIEANTVYQENRLLSEGI